MQMPKINHRSTPPLTYTCLRLQFGLGLAERQRIVAVRLLRVVVRADLAEPDDDVLFGLILRGGDVGGAEILRPDAMEEKACPGGTMKSRSAAVSANTHCVRIFVCLHDGQTGKDRCGPNEGRVQRHGRREKGGRRFCTQQEIAGIEARLR